MNSLRYSIRHLQLFMLYPENWPNLLKSWQNRLIEFPRFVKNITISFAKRDKQCSTPRFVIPAIADDWRTAMAIGSMANKNNKGDTGQPCQLYLRRLKSFENSATGSVYNNCIHLRNLSPQTKSFQHIKQIFPLSSVRKPFWLPMTGLHSL